MAYKTPEKKRKHDQRYRKQHKDELLAYNHRYYREHKNEILGQQQCYRQEHVDEQQEHQQIKRCGSVERYNEAMLKYDGECAFACDRKAYLVHHMDGKSTHNSPSEEVNNALTNLLPLCNSCHTWLHRNKPKYDYREIENATHRRRKANL